MDEDEVRFLQRAVGLKFFTPGQAGQIRSKQEELSRQRRRVSTAELALYYKLLTPSQIQQIQMDLSPLETPSAASDPTPLSPGSTQVGPSQPMEETLKVEVNFQEKVLKPRSPGALPIQKELGKGGYGAVYEVIEPLSYRPVALKVISLEKAQKFSLKQRFMYEIEITSGLQHPHIIPLYSSGYLEDTHLPFDERI